MNKRLDVLKNDVRAQGDMVTALNAADTTADFSGWIMASRYAAIKLNLFADNSFSGAIKVWGSDQYEAPNFTDPVSFTNQFQQIAAINTGATDTTPLLDIELAADGLTSYELNTNGLKWVAVELDAVSAGDISAGIIGYNL